jgi:hypothetical protein
MSGRSYSKHPDAIFADEALDRALWRSEFAESGFEPVERPEDDQGSRLPFCPSPRRTRR